MGTTHISFAVSWLKKMLRKHPGHDQGNPAVLDRSMLTFTLTISGLVVRCIHAQTQTDTDASLNHRHHSDPRFLFLLSYITKEILLQYVMTKLTLLNKSALLWI